MAWGSPCDGPVVDFVLFLIQSLILVKMVQFALERSYRLVLPRKGPTTCRFLSRLLDLALVTAVLPFIYLFFLVFSFWCIRKSNSYELLPYIDEHETTWIQIVDPAFSAI